ncbi:MAG TPA: SpoIIE family protein phosphatase [Planctomycetota bacterium]|nr:SpoIIE family protein phosphatase [Planctomycetota bacterium]
MSDTQRFARAAMNVPMERRVRDLEAILAITRKMAAEPDLTRLLVYLAQACSRVLNVERTSIWIVDPESGDLFTRVAEGMDAIRVPAGKGIVGAVQSDGQPLLIPDAYADARFNSEVDKKSGFRTRQILCHPLKDIEGQRVVGVIQALNKADGEFTAYDQELAAIIGAQVGVVLEQAALREQAMERKRLQAELNLARTIQERLLPRESPRTDCFEFAGTNQPATETSGDYYDYVTLPDGRIGLIIADVTGHGLGAALVMNAARAYMRAMCTAQSAPNTILAGVNDLLEKDLEAGNFLSLCLAAFDPSKKTLHYASAGHDPPLAFRPGQDQFAELDSTGPLLGILQGAPFELAGPLELSAGDVLVFMTDGLFECMNAEDETFGKQRLQDCIRSNAAKSADEILKALLAATAEWTGARPRRDDITVVVVKVR